MTIAVPTSGFREYKWIVSATAGYGTHTTIQAAINAASAGDTILIRDGTYVENITLKAGVSLVAASTDVTVQGKILFTDTGIGTVTGFTLTNNADYVLEMTGANNSQLFVEGCYFDQTNAGMLHQANSNASSIMWVFGAFMSQVANQNFFDHSGAGVLYLEGINSTGPVVTIPSTISGSGTVEAYYCALSCPITVSGTGNLVMKFTTNIPGIDANAYALGGTGAGPNQFDHCYLAGQIVIDNPNGFTITQISQVSSQTNVITGTGKAILGMITFFGSGTGVNTSTIIKLTTYGGIVSQNFGVQTPITSVNFGMSPYTALSTDVYLSVDTSGGAITILLPNNPGTGNGIVIKDKTGNAGANNISVTTPGGVVTFDGVATYVMNTNFQEMIPIFNGTSYEVN